MSSPSDLATAIQDYMQNLYDCITDPAQAIIIFTQLTQVDVPAAMGTDVIGNAQQQLQDSIIDFWNRTAITFLAQASSAYQPVSYEDAEALRDSVCGVIDTAITQAGDEGDDQNFMALKTLRSAVVQDITARGAALAALSTFNIGSPQPALTLAYRLYQDISRTDQLVAFTDVPHPAFMPQKFQALAF